MKKKICKSCGASLKLNMVYCPKCGVPVRPKTKTELGKNKYRLLKNWKFWSLAALGLLLVIRICGGVRYYLSGDVNLSAISRQLAMPDVELTEEDLVSMPVNTAPVSDTAQTADTEDASSDAPQETVSDAAENSSLQEDTAGDDSVLTDATGEEDEAYPEEVSGSEVAEAPQETPVSEATSVYQQTGDTQTGASEETVQEDSPSTARSSSQGTAQETAAQTVTETASVQPQATVQPQTVSQQTAVTPAVEDQAAVLEAQLAAYENYLDQNLAYIFDGNYTLSRNGSNYYIDVWVNGAAAEMEAIKAGKITQSEWAVFKDSLSSRAYSMYSRAFERGLSGVHVNLDFLNDTDLSRVLISYSDGVETFDALR